jgi:Flp pilus assembly protein TadD
MWNNRGEALAKLGQTEEARAAFRRATELDAEFYLGWSNLADVAQESGLDEEAQLAAARTADLMREED